MIPLNLASADSNALSGLETALSSHRSLKTNATGPVDHVNSNSLQQAKLEKAAQDFEAILLNSLWGSMKEGSLGAHDEDQEDPIMSSMSQLGIQMVSSAVAKAGGFGIARMITNELAPKV